jgi:outer membrane protein OmpA-like peptidoglycan-associated protein
MSKKLVYLLWILLTIIIGCILSWWLCCNSSSIDENSKDTTKANTTTSLKEATKNPFNVTDSKTGFSIFSKNNFNFNQSNASLLTPVSDTVNTKIDELKAYLFENPNKTLNVVGHFKNEETNTTNFENLGLARANAIKQYLISKGIPDTKITTKSILNNAMNSDANAVLFGPVTFTLLSDESKNTAIQDREKKAKEDAKAKMEALKKSILLNPLKSDFGHAEFNYTVSDSERKKIDNIVNYLNTVDGSILSVIGHTDNSGSTTTNYRLGQKRADFLKNTLIKNGVPANKIKTSSKGEDEPIASNATEAGRKKNRRIECKLNK